MLWNSKSGRPIHNAIVWQDRRTANFTDRLRATNLEMIRHRTGLFPDPYFSGSKLKWLLDNIESAGDLARRGELKFGTIDAWLMWKLSGGKIHATDYSNASRTMLFNIRKLAWDDALLSLMDIPGEIMPDVLPSSHTYGYSDKGLTEKAIPIAGDAGDQQAALFGHAAFERGQIKSTYGTGSFVLANAGRDIPDSGELITTIAWGLRKNDVTYALEGSVFASGAGVEWLRSGMGLIGSGESIESLASTATNAGGLYFVPALTGLGAPHWDPHARGLIIGITRGTKRAHIARAAIEAMAYQTRDVMEKMNVLLPARPEELRVDGGAAANDLLMQFQADILGIRVDRPEVSEMTALGACYLAGLSTGIWKKDELPSMRKVDRVFEPSMSKAKRERLYNGWIAAVEKSMKWARVVD